MANSNSIDEFKQKYPTWKDHLKFLRDDFSDEIPNEILHSTSENNKYKVRKAWWVGLHYNLEQGLYEGEYSQFQEEIKNFCEDYFLPQKFFHQRLTTEEDIDRANKLIDRILS